MKTFRIPEMQILIIFLLCLSFTLTGRSEEATQPETEKGTLEIWFRLISTPMTEREIYYHVCRLYINDKEIGESPAVNKENKWIRLFSIELEEGVYSVKVLHGYASKQGIWAGEFPKQPRIFNVGIKKGPETIIKYSYNVGLVADEYVYDKLPQPPARPAPPKISPEHKPRIMVIIPEQHLRRQRIPDPAAETEIIRKFVENDFWVVDQSQVMEIRYNDESKRAMQGDNSAAAAIGRQFDAEVLIIGEAFSQRIDINSTDIIGCNARVEARAIKVDTGQILAAQAAIATTNGNTEEIASKESLAEAGRIVGDYMVREIARKWLTAPVPSVRVKLTNVDFKQLVLFEQMLKERVKISQRFHRRSFDVVGKTAEIDVDAEGGAQALSTELTAQDFPDFDIEVLNFTANTLDLRLKPKETVPTGLTLNPKTLILIEQTEPDKPLRKCKVMVLKVDEKALDYNWAVEYADGSSMSGLCTIDGFDKSHEYGIAWSPTSETITKSTFPWISYEVFQELRDNGFSTIVVDKDVRKDAIVMSELKGIASFAVDVNGKKMNLKAMEVSTDKGDKLLILDELQNPLVLSAEVAGRYKSKITAIYIPGYNLR